MDAAVGIQFRFENDPSRIEDDSPPVLRTFPTSTALIVLSPASYWGRSPYFGRSPGA